MSGKTTSIYIEWIKTDISYIYIEWLTKDSDITQMADNQMLK